MDTNTSLDQPSLIDIIRGMSSRNLDNIISRFLETSNENFKRELEARNAEYERQKAEELEKQKMLEAKAHEEKKQHVEEVTSMDLPLDWENVFDSDPRTSGVHADSIGDALILSRLNVGKVDIEYISAITGGTPYKTVIGELKKKGLIFQNPNTWNEVFYQGWETRDEYLSGNLMMKLKAAISANETYDGYFSDNVAALKAVMPPAVAREKIHVTLGNPLTPTKMIDAFIEHMFGKPINYVASRDYDTIHDEATGIWEIPYKDRYLNSVATKKTYGTAKLGALYILENMLNMKSVTIRDKVDCPTSKTGYTYVINREDTVAAMDCQKRIRHEFEKWIWEDEDRAGELIDIFTEKYGTIKKRQFDGSLLTLPGLNPDVALYPYQKDAIARIIYTPNTLLAHDVGAGKTYVMIAAGQELRRMGLSRKNMYVVPNNITDQWKNIFSMLYPNSNVLVVDPKSFVPEKRQAVLRQITDNDYDGIIIAYSCFEMIPLSKECRINNLNSRINRLYERIYDMDRYFPKLNQMKNRLEKELKKLKESEDEPEGICFDELGITRLFVDEAHNFKNVPITTQVDNVLGINTEGSSKCKDMLDKVHLVQRENDGKGVVFATGTPITNSVTDVYVMQLYLQSAELAMLDIECFDGWIGLFAEKSTEFEIDVDTNSFRLATRFSKFHNLPELSAMLATFADFHQMGEESGIPEFEGYTDELVSKTPEFENYLKEISARADDVRNRRVDRTEDNMLKITTDGRKAALDLRLVDENAGFSHCSKVAACAKNVADIFFKTAVEKRTQLIFCDTSTPKSTFNIYDELKRLLIMAGVPEKQIAFIHNATTSKKREALFKKVQDGNIRILIGSTFKLGLGVNVQDRLVAIHHIDVPWRPADMTQREGRILRQGNTCEKVSIYRYVTEGSFDAYSWQLLETKQRFINALLSGMVNEESSSDIDRIVLSYAEVKALAVNNPLIKERFETYNELNRFETLQKKLVESRLRLEEESAALPERIKDQEEKIRLCKADIAIRDKWIADNPPMPDPSLPEDEAKKKLQKEEAEQRKQDRERVTGAVRDNILETKDRFLMDYHGFSIILPANMTVDKPFIKLRGESEYKIELGDTEIGNLVRIDNFIQNLDKYLDRLHDGLVRQIDRQCELHTELAKDESYADTIAAYKQKLENIDEQLGVDKDE